MTFALMMLAALPASGAWADDDHNKREAERLHEQRIVRAAVARGDMLPLPRLITIVRKRVPGEIIEVELDKDDGVYTYEFKVLTASGRVFEVEVDARTGIIIDIEDD